ncbi:MAG: single-stranded DNA-binding protein [Chloroflexi bacterium]|nr:single-stranded DNA-binding protein [Chloroflexota bacterium]
MSYLKIIFVGNLGADPEMRYMPNGQAVTNFSAASNRRWTDKTTGEPREETTWVRVAVWGKLAETVNQYLSKGRKVLVEGRLAPDSATGGPKTFSRHDGTVGTSYEVVASNVTFLDSNGNDNGNGQVVGQAATAEYETDDIPF